MQDRAGAVASDPFARRAWSLEIGAHVAVKTWNCNVAHESLVGSVPGVTYGRRDGAVLTAAGPLYCVDQRGVDADVLGVTFGVRGRGPPCACARQVTSWRPCVRFTCRTTNE